MKLVDILARELNQWPDALGHAAGQAADGTLHSEMEPEDAETAWTIESYTICSNWISDIVTRAEWQAAVDALNSPKVVEWDGVGDPPAMSKIEYKSVGGAWKKGVFVGRVYGKIVAGCDDTETVGWLPSDEMRPIRTAEQVAAEEREAEDNEVMSRYISLSDCEKGILGHSPERAIIGLMRVMGYRKEPKPCGS